MINRRVFLQQTSLAAVSFLVIPTAFANFKGKRPLVGMQLYCVRDAMKKDFAGTL
jgi:hypothetical protein